MTPLWLALIAAALGSYALKLAGVSLPESALNHPRVQRIAGLLPIAMLAALVAAQLFDHHGRYGFDWRTLAGVGAGVIALLLKQGFLVVFLTAITVTAALRLLTIDWAGTGGPRRMPSPHDRTKTCAPARSARRACGAASREPRDRSIGRIGRGMSRSACASPPALASGDWR